MSSLMAKQQTTAWARSKYGYIFNLATWLARSKNASASMAVFSKDHFRLKNFIFSGKKLSKNCYNIFFHSIGSSQHNFPLLAVDSFLESRQSAKRRRLKMHTQPPPARLPARRSNPSVGSKINSSSLSLPSDKSLSLPLAPFCYLFLQPISN